MIGGGFAGSIHDDVYNANPSDDESKRRLMDEIKNRAKGSLSTRNFPEAVKLYTKGIELNIENANAILLSNRSMCYYNLGCFAEALMDAESSLSLDPSYAKAYYRKGVALISLKENKKAEEAFREGLKLVPSDKDFLAQLEKTERLIQLTQSPPPPPPPTKVNTSKSSSASAVSASAATQNKLGDDSAAAAIDDADEDDIDASKLRGYKKTVDGKTTTYFHNELDANTKALIGDIAPKKIEGVCATATPTNTAEGSAWNAAGTWEEKVFTPWATQRLTELLKHASVTIDGSVVTVSEVKSVEGDAQITLMRGRRKHIYDFKAELEWAVKGEGSDTTGKIIITDITGDEDYEFQVEGGRELSAGLLRSRNSGLQLALRAALSSFCAEFKLK